METLTAHLWAGVVTSLDFETSDFGPSFAVHVSRMKPAVPYIILSARPIHELPAQVRPRNVMFLPVQMDVLLERCRHDMIDKGGEMLSGISMDVALQVLHQEGKTGLMRVEAESLRGVLVMRQGQIVFAETQEKLGREALFDLLATRKMTLRVISSETDSIQANIHEPFDNLLLQWSVHRDECAA